MPTGTLSLIILSLAVMFVTLAKEAPDMFANAKSGREALTKAVVLSVATAAFVSIAFMTAGAIEMDTTLLESASGQSEQNAIQSSFSYEELGLSLDGDIIDAAPALLAS